jgi:hypothetical protein
LSIETTDTLAENPSSNQWIGEMDGIPQQAAENADSEIFIQITRQKSFLRPPPLSLNFYHSSSGFWIL